MKFFFFEVVHIEGNDMAPLLQDGDWVVISRLIREPARGDVIFFEHPQKNGYFLRRTIGLPEEKVGVRHEQPEINGDFLKRETIGTVEWHDYYRGQRERTTQLNLMTESTPEGRTYQILKDPQRRSTRCSEISLNKAYFVMADNRNHGTDSCSLGPIPKEHIRGSAIYRLAGGQPSILQRPSRQKWQAIGQ